MVNRNTDHSAARSKQCLNCNTFIEIPGDLPKFFEVNGAEVRFEDLLERYLDINVAGHDPRDAWQLCSDCIDELTHLYVTQQDGYAIIGNEPDPREPVEEDWQDESQFIEEEPPPSSAQDSIDEVEFVDDYDIYGYLNEALNIDFDCLHFDWESDCRFCGVSFIKFEDFIAHITVKHASLRDTKILCGISKCQKSFANTKFLAKHIVMQHCALGRIQILSFCPHCSKQYTNFYQLNKHSCCTKLKWKSGQRNYCEKCELHFPSFKRYNFHAQFHLAKCRPKACLICEELFSEPEKLFEHVQYAHEESARKANYSYSKCDKTFDSKSRLENCEERRTSWRELLRYKQRNTRKGTPATKWNKEHFNCNDFKCQTCGQVGISKMSLAVHIARSHSSQSSRCGLCRACFSDATSLKKHMESVHQPIQCEYCPQRILKTKRSYERHLRVVHCREERFACTFCSKGFFYKWDKDNHEKLLHGNAKFKCIICPFETVYERSMKSHALLHEQRKPCKGTKCRKISSRWKMSGK